MRWLGLLAVLAGVGCAGTHQLSRSSSLTRGLVRVSDYVSRPVAQPHEHACALHPTQAEGIGTLLGESAHSLTRKQQLELITHCYDIPVKIHPRVEWWIRYYQRNGRRTMTRFLSRTGRYGPMLRETLRDAGLPQDLLYVAVAESGLAMHARSSAGAVGPWQFMPATGRQYGLQEDYWVDPRRDPKLATVAAATHLKWLYDRFDDWHIAAAGYNAGAGKLRRAISIYGTADYWKLRTAGPYLRQETKDYVPKILAIALIAKHPGFFGFHNLKYQAPMQHDTVPVDDATSLEAVAVLADSSVEELRQLNPALKRFCTPPNRHWELRVPLGTGTSVARGLLAARERYTFHTHTMRKGETVAMLARRYETDAAAILRQNDIRNPRTISIGTELIIPILAELVASATSSGMHAAPAPTE